MSAIYMSRYLGHIVSIWISNFLYVHVPMEMIQQSLCFIAIKHFHMLFSDAMLSLSQSKGIK